MKIGLSAREITPVQNHTLVGIDSGRMAEGALDPLHVRVLCFEDASDNRAAIVVCEILYVGTALASRICDAINERLGIDNDRVMVVATHTHSAPKTSEDFEDGNAVETAFCDRVAEQALEAAVQAFKNMKPATVSVATSNDAPAVNRRLPLPFWAKLHGTMRTLDVINRPNRSVRSDTGITAFKIVYDDGSYFWIASAALHSSVFRGNKYSSDFPGYILPAIKLADDGEGCIDVVYLQGWTGDQAADLTVHRPFSLRPGALLEFLISREAFNRKGTTKELAALGERLGRALASSEAVAATLETDIVTATQTIDLPLEDGTSSAAKVKLVRAGPMRFVAVNGEPFASYRRMVLHDETLPHTMTIGYLDGPFGYLPDAAGLAQGGYEPDRSLGMFRQAARFDQSAEALFCREVRKVMQDAG